MQKTYTILCVDDEEGIVESLERALKLDGYKVFTALSGVQGLEVLEKENVDLVISDQRMPNMSGYEFLKIVREKYPHVARIILSAHTDFDSLVQSINEGEIFRFFYKPWNLVELRKAIKAAIEQNQLVYRVSGLLKHFKKVGGFLDDIVVEQEHNNMILKITAKERMDSMDEVLRFFDSILEALGLKAEGGGDIVANAVSKNRNNLIFTIDLGKNVTLKVEIPISTGSRPA